MRPLDLKMEHLCEVPLRYGKIVGICTWHDEVFVATDYEGLFRLVVNETADDMPWVLEVVEPKQLKEGLTFDNRGWPG
jgi:hypothetical protein